MQQVGALHDDDAVAGDEVGVSTTSGPQRPRAATRATAARGKLASRPRRPASSIRPIIMKISIRRTGHIHRTSAHQLRRRRGGSSRRVCGLRRRQDPSASLRDRLLTHGYVGCAVARPLRPSPPLGPPPPAAAATGSTSDAWRRSLLDGALRDEVRDNAPDEPFCRPEQTLDMLTAMGKACGSMHSQR